MDKLINVGPTQVQVPVVGPKGQRDTLFLQPGGRLTVPLGYSLAPEFVASANPKILVNHVPLGTQRRA